MIWKALFDIQTPTWEAYGRLWVFEAPTRKAAEIAACAHAGEKFPGATVTHMEITASQPGALAAYEARVERLRLWLANAAQGKYNDRRSL
jgi:hypothetical protein